MLKSHMEAKENALIAISRIPANAGHPLHKGTPREAFIKEFLETHLPANVAIGAGEIIDANSRPNMQRNQFDIVIYKKNYPKLDFGGGINGFLIESVIATVEVKSSLDQAGLEAAIKAAQASKSLTPNNTITFHAGYIPPKVLNYIIAYDGPTSMQTVFGWIPGIHASLGIMLPDLPANPDGRLQFPSPTIDGVFVLQKGFVYFDNVPYGFVNERQRQANPNIKWVFCDTTKGNLLLFFLFLQTATANIEGKWLNPLPYLQGIGMPNVRAG